MKRRGPLRASLTVVIAHLNVARMVRASFSLAYLVAAVLGVSAAACSSSSSSTADSGVVTDATSHDSGRDAGAVHDAHKDAPKPRDAGRDAIADATGPVGLTCSKLLGCDMACSTTACTNGCYAQSTGVAQGLFNAFTDCLNAQCPGADASACDTNAATGACVTQLLGCEGDKTVGPPDPDGGTVVTVHNDAGKALNCGELVSCQAACAPDAGACTAGCATQATAEARALQGTLNACLAMACPATDGGPCQTQGLTCSGCQEQVELAQPDTCADPYVACNSDTSNSPDGGFKPTSLEDGGQLANVVQNLDQPASTLVARNGNLYYTQVISGSPIYRLPLVDGGAPATFGPPLPTPVGLAVDSNNAYAWNVGTFALNSSTNNKDGTVVQVPLGGGAPITLATNMEVFYDSAYLNAISVDSANVYWVSGASGSDGAIMKTPIGSASPTALYSGQDVPMAVVSDGTNVYWTNLGTFDAMGNSNNDGSVWQGSVNGGSPVRLAANQPGPYCVAVDANNVYWTDLGPLGGDNLPKPSTGLVQQVRIGGGTAITLATTQAVPISILVVGSTVFWTEYGLSSPGLVMSAPVGGGTVVPLVAGLNDPFELTYSGNTLYWTNADSSATYGSIMSLSPF